MNTQKTAATTGLCGVGLFMISLLVFGFLNSNFHFFHDFVSMLGANGEPNALLWNIFGFGLTGTLLFLFGLQYGKVVGDRFAGLLLALFGVGFGFTAFPMDMMNDRSSVSKVHIVAICLALAFWLFGLARISSNTKLGKSIRKRANIAAILIVSSMLGVVIEIWSMPFAHRLIFVVVFGWTVISSISVLGKKSFSHFH